MGGKRNANVVQLVNGVEIIMPTDALFGGPASEDECQITFTAFDANGDEIIPSAGTLKVAVLPRGAKTFLDGDKDLNLTTGEFYRPFRVKATAFKLLVSNLDPSDGRVDVTFAVV